MSRRVVLIVGKVLAVLAFVSAAAVGILASLQGGALPVDRSVAGRPVMFLPIAYVPILVVGLIVAVIFVVKRLAKKRHIRREII